MQYVPQSSLPTLPREIHYYIVQFLDPSEHFCLSLTCRSLFLINPGKEALKADDRFMVLRMWESDHFFQGLVCSACRTFHRIECFDAVDKINANTFRTCIGISAFANLHPNWCMNYRDFQDVFANLRVRHLYDNKDMERDKEQQEKAGRHMLEIVTTTKRSVVGLRSQEPAGLEDVEDLEELKNLDDVEDLDLFGLFHELGVTVSDIFSSSMLGRELSWRETWFEDLKSHTRQDLRDLSTFGAVKHAAISVRSRSRRALVIDDLDAWVTPVQFFGPDDGSVQATLIWFLNLDCLKAPHALARDEIAKEIDKKDLCINICPHIKMNDERIVAARPNVPLFDSIHDRKLALQGFECSQCLTRIKVQIRNPAGVLITRPTGQRYLEPTGLCLAIAVIRNFGRLQSSSDSAWISQLQTEEDIYSEALAMRATYGGNWQGPPSSQEWKDWFEWNE